MAFLHKIIAKFRLHTRSELCPNAIDDTVLTRRIDDFATHLHYDSVTEKILEYTPDEIFDSVLNGVDPDIAPILAMTLSYHQQPVVDRITTQLNAVNYTNFETPDFSLFVLLHIDPSIKVDANDVFRFLSNRHHLSFMFVISSHHQVELRADLFIYALTKSWDPIFMGTPLFREIIHRLLRHSFTFTPSIDLFNQSLFGGLSLIQVLIKRCPSVAVEILTDPAVNLDQVDRCGNTLLHFSVNVEADEVTPVLMELKPDLAQRCNHDGFTPFEML